METNINFLKNNDHNFYNEGTLTFELSTCEDCSQKNKKYNKERKNANIHCKDSSFPSGREPVSLSKRPTNVDFP